MEIRQSSYDLLISHDENPFNAYRMVIATVDFP